MFCYYGNKTTSKMSICTFDCIWLFFLSQILGLYSKQVCFLGLCLSKDYYTFHNKTSNQVYTPTQQILVEIKAGILDDSYLTVFIACTPTQVMGGGGVWWTEPFSRTFIQEEPRSNQDFWWELTLQLGFIFFCWDLKTLCIKNSESKSQKKKKKKDFSHFQSPTLTNFW